MVKQRIDCENIKENAVCDIQKLSPGKHSKNIFAIEFEKHNQYSLRFIGFFIIT